MEYLIKKDGEILISGLRLPHTDAVKLRPLLQKADCTLDIYYGPDKYRLGDICYVETTQRGCTEFKLLNKFGHYWSVEPVEPLEEWSGENPFDMILIHEFVLGDTYDDAITKYKEFSNSFFEFEIPDLPTRQTFIQGNLNAGETNLVLVITYDPFAEEE